MEGARIKADLQKERGHSSERPPSAVVEGIAISYRSFPRGPKHTRCCGGEKKNKAISERKHVKSIAAPGSSAPGTLRLSRRAAWKSHDHAGKHRGRRGGERIGKVEIVPAKLLSRNGLP